MSAPILEDWTELGDGRLEGRVKDHPEYEDGDLISIAPPTVSNPPDGAVIETASGSQYALQGKRTEVTTTFFPDPTAEMQVAGDMQQPQSPEAQPEELSETKKLMQQVKDAGIAGVISYALWEFGFWTLSVPVCIAGYRQITGHWPDFTNQEDLQKLGAEAFAFVNVARFAVPLRIGLALGTTPWIQTNVVDRFSKKEKTSEVDDFQ